MQECFVQSQPGPSEEKHSANSTATTDDAPISRALKPAATSTKTASAPARPSDRGPLDLVFAGAATITLWVVIIALAKWLL